MRRRSGGRRSALGCFGSNWRSDARPPERVVFELDGRRGVLAPLDDELQGDLAEHRERIRWLVGPIHIISKEEDS